MADAGSLRTGRSGRIKDARGRRVTQLDPIAMNLLGRRGVIPAKTLRKMAEEIDPGEVKKRRMGLMAGVLGALGAYVALFFYFRFLAKGSWRDPVMFVFYAGYLIFPPVVVYLKFRKARKARHERIRDVMLAYPHCPHCGYDLRGLPADPDDGATVCPECGCAWMVTNRALAPSAATREDAR